MNHLHTADRKNVTLLGEEDLTKVVGGYGYWRRRNGSHKSGGNGGRKSGGNGGGALQRDFGRGGRGNGNDDGGDTIINITINIVQRG